MNHPTQHIPATVQSAPEIPPTSPELVGLARTVIEEAISEYWSAVRRFEQVKAIGPEHHGDLYDSFSDVAASGLRRSTDSLLESILAWHRPESCLSSPLKTAQPACAVMHGGLLYVATPDPSNMEGLTILSERSKAGYHMMDLVIVKADAIADLEAL